MSAPDETTSSPVVEDGAHNRGRLITMLVALGAGLLFLVGAFVIAQHWYSYRPALSLAAASLPSDDRGSSEPDELEALTQKARKSLRALAPRSTFIVVDTAGNRLYVKKGDKVLLDAVCSTGSGGLLKDPATGREWVFETPQGYFQVFRKARDPIWTKPDWAFVEEGKPVPEKWSERLDDATLGDYALYIGNGYMIHGTLYQRYLGRSITHGCIRLGDADLERVYELAPVGTPVYIF